MAVKDTSTEKKSSKGFFSAMKNNFPKRSQNSQKKQQQAVEAKKNTTAADTLPLPGPLPALPTFSLNEERQEQEPRVLEPRYVDPVAPKSPSASSSAGYARFNHMNNNSNNHHHEIGPIVTPSEPRYVEPQQQQGKEYRRSDPRYYSEQHSEINGRAAANGNGHKGNGIANGVPNANGNGLPNGRTQMSPRPMQMSPRPIQMSPRPRQPPPSLPRNGGAASGGVVRGSMPANGAPNNNNSGVNGHHEIKTPRPIHPVARPPIPAAEPTSPTTNGNNGYDLSSSPPRSSPPPPPEIVEVAPPITKVHYHCYQDHCSMPASRNAWHSIPCMTCMKADRQIRFRCTFCCLRICSDCFDELQKIQDRSLSELVVVK